MRRRNDARFLTRRPAAYQLGAAKCLPAESCGVRGVIVGGGPAGVAAALAARQQDAAAEVVLLNDERHEPYEKPPLSKAVLTGKAMPQRRADRRAEGRRRRERRAQARTRVTEIDRGAARW